MSENPLVSIVVRTRDRPKLLEKALRSINAQTYRPIEVVLVNDGGCDLSEEILRDILKDVSLNYIRLKDNVGRARAGNIGIENAKGDYIGFLDDDDELYPEHLETLTSFLFSSDYKIAYTDSLMVYKDYIGETNVKGNYKTELAFSEDFNYDKLLFENYIPFMCLLFNRDVLIASGGFDSSLELYEDWDLLIRIGKVTPFYHIKKITSNYNQWSSDYQISQLSKDVIFLKDAYLRIINKHFDKFTPNCIHNYMSSYVSTRQMLKRIENELENVKGLLKEKDSIINRLENELEVRELKPRKFDSEISELNLKLKEKTSEIGILIENLKKKGNEINNLISILKEKESRLFILQNTLKQKENLIEAMKNTKGWRLLQKYRYIRDNFIFPVIRLLKNLQTVKEKFFSKVNETQPNKIDENNLIIKKNNLSFFQKIDEDIKSKVSIIIPTKNAGDEFDYTLQKMMHQEGVQDIELIIVDSGSEDGTIEKCRNYTDKIFEIKPEEFNHSMARNLGAEKATGEFLVFTVQDAIPIGNLWLQKLIYPIYKDQVSAVSVKQIPRSDADFFASWAVWKHNQYMGYDYDRVVSLNNSDDFDKYDIRSKRAAASLNNVCLGIRKSVFDAYKFNSNYAEDVELGIRLLKDKHRLLFQSSNAIIHSHFRPAIYFFKRSIIDTIILSKIFNISRNDLHLNSVFESISYLHKILKKCLFTMKVECDISGDSEYLINRFIEDFKDMLDSNYTHEIVINYPFIDNYFDGYSPENHNSITSQLFSAFSGSLREFSDFAKNYYIGDGVKSDFLESIYKIFFNTAGWFVGLNTRYDGKLISGEI